MLIHSLMLGGFRLFEEGHFKFEKGINLLLGPNAVGKTTLLEAIYLLLSGRSFRTSINKDLIRSGSSFFRVQTHFEKNGIEQDLKMTMTFDERSLHHNSTSLTSLRALLGILQGVLMAPHDIEMVCGPPTARRHYLDLQIAQVDPLYVHHLVRYAKALQHRNAQLKSRKLKGIEVFEEGMAHSAYYIYLQRMHALQDLELLSRRFYHQISCKEEPLALSFRPSPGHAKSPQDIFEKWRHHRDRDLEAGYTTIGPHRDDFKIHIKEREAAKFGSEGEMRTLAASLRLAEWERMRQMTKGDPLLLVDDFGISLDAERSCNLCSLLEGFGQVIVTSASENKNLNFISRGHIIRFS